MSVTFWDTIKGQQLAEILIRELPKLTKGTQQYAKSIKDDEVHEFLNRKLDAGERYINHYSHGGRTTIIMEMKKK